ncbi:pyridoxamine 5'-phosphate oxidase family protein [Nocardioides sp. cx-173]|uniref:pyridoxamine 5'-phosphate oxidase family protein n=1 Tax=Nocardioides sp. cx-173 TaxID=2898796 RepID=UPI001E505D56|nr:TIGR03618 family F420-dependent PPOX class oxidoreductase [Nocardioides sp. cx-173]MCD4526043.1 TIGR03618 family F420-dependent PPOX class oxidoreductase [Nocardioides sp. cx-173]UGB43738.1 TIGR03618 family F420-dependent PPOX class oxidoreductase [Nocardioides sp. cx-173]
MANQRAQIVMSHDEVVEFLHQQRSATVATLGPQGRPHLVGMWYAVHDGHVWIETKAKSQKVVNLRRDPTMSFLVEAGHTYDQLRGVALEGTGVVVEDPDVVWDVCVNVFERYNAPYTEELKPLVELMAKNRVVVRLDPVRTRSWDHRKLGLAPMDLGGSTAAFLS